MCPSSTTGRLVSTSSTSRIETANPRTRRGIDVVDEGPTPAGATFFAEVVALADVPDPQPAVQAARSVTPMTAAQRPRTRNSAPPGPHRRTEGVMSEGPHRKLPGHRAGQSRRPASERRAGPAGRLACHQVGLHREPVQCPLEVGGDLVGGEQARLGADGVHHAHRVHRGPQHRLLKGHPTDDAGQQRGGECIAGTGAVDHGLAVRIDRHPVALVTHRPERPGGGVGDDDPAWSEGQHGGQQRVHVLGGRAPADGLRLFAVADHQAGPPVEMGEALGPLGDLVGARFERQLDRRRLLEPVGDLVLVGLRLPTYGGEVEPGGYLRRPQVGPVVVVLRVAHQDRPLLAEAQDEVAVGRSLLVQVHQRGVDALGVERSDRVAPELVGPDERGECDVQAQARACDGGNAANAAVACARLGLHVALAAFVGADQLGRDAVAALNAEGVDTSLVHLDQQTPTNSDFVLRLGQERTILVRHAQHDYHWPHLRPSEVPAWLYLSSVGREAYAYEDQIADWLEETPSVELAFEPGTFQIAQGPQRLARLYRRAGLLICNREEAETICDCPPAEEMDTLLAAMLALGPRQVVITDAAAGAFGASGGGV